jgi:hypothetical protein
VRALEIHALGEHYVLSLLEVVALCTGLALRASQVVDKK